MTEQDTSRSVISGPLGRRTAFNLLVNGPWTKQAAQNLIKQLEFQIEWFDADDVKQSNAEIAGD
jgi:hypothetical protein